MAARGRSRQQEPGSATELIWKYEIHWSMEQFFKGSMPLLELGSCQTRSDGATVIHLQRVYVADALLTRRLGEEPFEARRRKRDPARQWGVERTFA